MYRVLVSRTFEKQFGRLPAIVQRNIRKALVQLADDPLTSRPGVDVKRLQATKPPKNRLRAGRYRVVYVVAGKEVRVLEVFAREKGYTE